MADKNIGSLTKAIAMNRDDLLLMEQQGEAKSLDLGQLQDFCMDAVAPYAESAETAAASASEDAASAETFMNNARGYMNEAKIAAEQVENETAAAIVEQHNTNGSAHRDIRVLIDQLTDRVRQLESRI